MNAPPLLVSFQDIESLIRALNPDVRAVHEAEISRLILKKLPPAVSARVVACLFGVSASFVGAMTRKPEKYYRTFKIKSGKKLRTINAPRVALKIIQKWLGSHLAEALDFGPQVFGFIAGKSAAQAAAVHCDAQWVYSVDIADFFPSIKFDQVCSGLIDVGYSNYSAALIAKFNILGSGLAQGSPASPVLSNLVFRSADAELATLAANVGARYTRYADDIVFSGIGNFPTKLRSAIAKIITTRGWKLADGKEHLAMAPLRLKVHGLLVNGKFPRLTKGYRNRIRAYRHILSANKKGIYDTTKMRGHIAYADSVESLTP